MSYPCVLPVGVCYPCGSDGIDGPRYRINIWVVVDDVTCEVAFGQSGSECCVPSAEGICFTEDDECRAFRHVGWLNVASGRSRVHNLL